VSRYRLSPEAARDLEDIKLYLVEQAGPTVARYVLRRLRQAMMFLAATPGVGHKRSDLTDEDVRFWSVFSYLIVYIPHMRPIGIARVLHGARDLEALFARMPPEFRP
jgi:toxin ParE1/3/4